jgi:hypothetical protein
LTADTKEEEAVSAAESAGSREEVASAERGDQSEEASVAAGVASVLTELMAKSHVVMPSKSD